ncbi:MAG TPA: aldo/keto reductase [Acidobacteriota bacterium]|nr:aldo/keto reductase [Acidobacteriota bacterium]
MKRRTFIGVAAAAVGGLASGQARAETLARREYKDGMKLGVIGFGGIVVCGLGQAAADRIVAEAFDRGVNYYDVAPSYFDGEAETKLGPALEPYRKRSFLACKTTERDAAGSRKELERSLKRLRTDHFDLYQFHAVSSLEDVDKILAPGGAGETFLKARTEGKVRYLGASLHNAEAGMALMDKFPLDSVLFPVNFVLFEEGHFGPQILEHAKKKGIARLALKTLAHHAWPKGADRSAWPKCWYKPIDDPALAEESVRFTLSEDVTAAIPPGEEKLFRMALDCGARFRPLEPRERRALLEKARGLAPIFRA